MNRRFVPIGIRISRFFMKRASFSPEGFLSPPLIKENGRSSGRRCGHVHYYRHPPSVTAATFLSPASPASSIVFAQSSLGPGETSRGKTIATLPVASPLGVAIVVVVRLLPLYR